MWPRGRRKGGKEAYRRSPHNYQPREGRVAGERYPPNPKRPGSRERKQGSTATHVAVNCRGGESGDYPRWVAAAQPPPSPGPQEGGCKEGETPLGSTSETPPGG